MVDSGYSVDGGTATIGGGDTAADAPGLYWSHERLKRSYLNYLDLKRAEIDEQIIARRYRHAVQWTSDQLQVFKKRKQPVVTFNRVGRKIDSVIGLVEKLRQSPKGYPRTTQEMQRGGADLATAIIKEVLDAQAWKDKSPIAAERGATDGIGGVELTLEQGDLGDPDVGFEIVEPDSFFYDPRSFKLDFSDARFLGQGKWVDLDTAIELFPDKEDELRNSIESGANLTAQPDRENKWFFSDSRDIKRIRMVSEDYRSKGKWCYAVYTGSLVLAEGVSPFIDEKKKTTSRFLMFSANVDQDGDRYGFVRNMKSAQDEINMRRSKGLHILNSRGIIAEGGAFNDIEEARIEAARPDMVLQPNPGKKVEFDESARIANLEGQLKFLEDAKNEIDSFGPNPQLTGQGISKDQSGRAIALLQQAGIAELGPFMLSYRGWKIRLYRAIWNAVRIHWTKERAVRVTDDERAVNFIEVNGVGVDPMTGMPTMVNTLGTLDVDIVLDEGPDSISLIQDTHDALMALAQSGTQIPPEIMFEFMPGLDPDTKKRMIEKLNQPNPMQQQAQQLELAGGQAKVQDTQAAAQLKQAQAQKIGWEMNQPPEQAAPGKPPEHPMQTMANIQETMASARAKDATAQSTHARMAKQLQDIQFRPLEFAQDADKEARKAELDQLKIHADLAKHHKDTVVNVVQGQQKAEADMVKAKQKPSSPAGA
jgi:hypothetical protein